MERALPNALVPDRGTGFQFSNSPLGGRMTWMVAALRQTDDSGRGFSADVAYDIGARITALPLYREKGAYLVHIGASYVHQFRSGEETVRYRARPETALAERVISTGKVATRGQDLFGFELAVVSGPFSIQGEIIGSVVNQRGGSETIFWGAYGMATLSLTGEHREFDKESATFGRLEPTHKFDPQKGHWGAWELAARVSYLDLDDNGVQGGQLRNATYGVNWHLYPNFRWMLNYVLSDKKGTGVSRIGQIRFQLDF
jgi:phosphate-selective porin OprO and OprP